jgi:hypothetical protein
MAGIGEGVFSDTSTTCPGISVIVNPVGVAVTSAHPSCTTNGGAPTWFLLFRLELARVAV